MYYKFRILKLFFLFKLKKNENETSDVRGLVEKSLKFRKSIRTLALDQNLKIPKKIQSLLLKAW